MHKYQERGECWQSSQNENEKTTEFVMRMNGAVVKLSKSETFNWTWFSRWL